MSSVILKLEIVTVVLCLAVGINSAQNGQSGFAQGPIFSRLSGTKISAYNQQPSNQQSSLMDLLILGRLADMDSDVEEPLYFSQLLSTAGNTKTSFGTPQRSPPVTSKKTKSHKHSNSSGGTTFVSFLCAYCLQFGFNLCASRYCFGMLMSNGEKWKEHRRFTLSTLKDFGMGKRVLEKRIHEQIELLFESFDEEKGEPFNPKHATQTAVGNVICSMVFGKMYEKGDKKFRRIADAFEENLSSGIIAGMLNFIPALQWLPGDLFSLKKMIRNSDYVFEFVGEVIDEHKQKFDEDNIDDYVTAYIHRLNQLEKSGEKTTFSLHELGATFADLFGAGTETTATTLLWSFPLIASHPEIQNRLFEEIQMHVGIDRLPSVQDKSNLTYVEAFYNEVLRYSNLTLAGVPRSLVHDLNFHGYLIPAGAMVFVDMSSVLFDPKIWTDPENFRPERFIDETGKLKKSEELIAFSIGKRSCVGESLARMELFLFLSSIIQRYELICPDGKDLTMATIDGEYRTVHAPKSYEIIFKRRSL